MCNLNTKQNFKVPKKSCEFLTIFFQNLENAKKCNFTNFDTSSVLQINCSNTYDGNPEDRFTSTWLVYLSLTQTSLN